MAFSWTAGIEPSTALLSWRSLGVVILATLALFFSRLYQERMQFRRMMREYDIPILPHSFLFGHLIHLGKALAPYPRDFTKLGVPYALLQAYPEICEPGIVYFDSWPFGGTTACVFSPELVSQFTQDSSLPKSPLVARELTPFTGLRDLVTMEGQEWKFWRSVFNPGFSAKNLTAMVPGFLEEIQVLKERLLKAAGTGEVVVMEKTVQTATVDLICRAALGIRLHSQTRNTEFVKSLMDQIWWCTNDYSLINRLKENFPLRPFFMWNNSRRMRNFLAPLIEAGVTKADGDEETGYKTINSLAIKAYRTEKEQLSTKSTPTSKPDRNKVDPEFLETAIAQLKIFIFAGHDTTASTISFAYSLLFQHPTALANCRAEHTAILGPDPSAALARLTENPTLLNQLPYTLAVLKETLRLYPPAATARDGPADDRTFHLVHPTTGKAYPTPRGMLVWSASFLTHRHPAYWPRADEFLPERWLAGEGDPLYQTRKGAWRPFELGPRNCIGQELAMLEMRAVLVMTLRELDLEPVYAAGAPRAIGERAYQVMGVGDITGHVKDGFPVRVRVRSGEEIEGA